jgi:ribulose-5-phosphate 4-epimerase/fuculose-1-phosphate aldolase
MLYINERTQALEILEELKRHNLIDCVGGAISMRCNENHMIITTTGSAFKRWNITEDDFIVLNLKGDIIEASSRLGPSGTPLHLGIYESFPECKSIIHTHSQYSLAFASLGLSVPSSINATDVLGEVPCFICDDQSVKQQLAENPLNLQIPAGIVQRQDVFAINTMYLLPQLKEKLLPRRMELLRHGLAFTVYRHGIYVMAKNINEAFENLVRVETNARTYIYGCLVSSNNTP